MKSPENPAVTPKKIHRYDENGQPSDTGQFMLVTDHGLIVGEVALNMTERISVLEERLREVNTIALAAKQHVAAQSAGAKAETLRDLVNALGDGDMLGGMSVHPADACAPKRVLLKDELARMEAEKEVPARRFGEPEDEYRRRMQ